MGGNVRTGDGYYGSYVLHILTVREDLLQGVVDFVNGGTHLEDAFLSASQELPGVQGLADLKRLYPTALPSWLARHTVALSKLDVRADNHVVFNEDKRGDTPARAAEREAQLERFSKCRFQEGFASEGMLCNLPPLPLRVLDYLDAADLLSLSLVCKATHRASHYLFHREEEVLNRSGIRTYQLEPRYQSWSILGGPRSSCHKNPAPARHRAMRAASLLWGRPKALDVTMRFPRLPLNLFAAPDKCTQPHVDMEFQWKERHEDLTDLLEARRVDYMGGRVWLVDPEGWPSRDREAIAKLRRKVRQNFRGGYLGPEAIDREVEGIVEKIVEDVGRVFETAREHGQRVLMFEESHRE